MSQPPRAFESILKNLGADPYLIDVILGDLAEEFSQRVAFDGEKHARRWYRREAMRAVPHLLRSAGRQLRVGDIPRLVGVALFSWVALMPASIIAYVVVVAVTQAMGVHSLAPWLSPKGPGFATFVMLAMPLIGAAGGYVAAWRNARAPLIGAAAFGTVMTSMNVIAGLFGSSPVTIGFRIAALALFNVAAIAGGTLRVIGLKPSTGSALSTS